MKLYNILTVSALSLILAGAAGCTKEVDYDPAAVPTGAQIFFASNAASSFSLEDGQNSVTVDVNRLNTSGSVSANVKATATVGGESTGIFSIPSTVSFSDGAETAPITITFDFDNIEAETTYSISLELEGEGLSNYGKTTQNISILYAPWSSWAKMDGDAYWTTEMFGGTYNYPIFERKSLLNPSQVQYDIPDLVTDDHDIVISVNTSTNEVSVPAFDTGYATDGVNIWMTDVYTFYTEVFPNPQKAEIYKDASYFNPETGVIYVLMQYYLPDGRGWSPEIDTFQLPGYPDYNISMTNAGTYISEAGQEYTILSVVKGSDVASYAIELKQGYLKDEEIEAEVEAIIANDETVLYNDNRDFQFPVFEKDYYTCITVSYDAAGKAQGHNAYMFYNEINGVDWNEGWTTVTKTAEFSDVFFAGLFYDKPYSWEVEVQKSNDNPGYYRIVKPYANNVYEEEVERGHYYVYIDATDPENVEVLPSLTSYGYYVLSVPGTYGKLVDGTKFEFPAASLGVFQDNADGSMKVLSGWKEEAVLLDLDPQEEPEPQAVQAHKAKAQKLTNAPKAYKGLLMPYNGKKIEKQAGRVNTHVKKPILSGINAK